MAKILNLVWKFNQYQKF